MSTVTVKISGSTVSTKDGTLQISNRIDQRSQVSLTVEDSTGTGNYGQGQLVTVQDSVQGLLYAGFIDTAEPDILAPGIAKEWTLDCKDNHYLADKRYFTGADYLTPRLAGDIVIDIHALYLASEGVQAVYSSRHDKDTTTFSQGTLSGVTASNNTLTLAPAGSKVTFHDGGLTSTTDPGIALKGTAAQGFNNNYVYVKVYATNTAIAAGDTLNYDVWIDPTSPAIMAGVDFVCTDGSTLRDSTGAGLDAQGMAPHPKTDLSGLADKNNWYSRQIGINSPLVGKTISYFTVAFEGDNAGNYAAYFKNIQYRASGGAVKLHILDATQTTPAVNAILSNNGYSNVSLTAANVYHNVTNVVRTLSIDAAKIVKSSSIAWTTSLANGGAATVETSVDNGATWQAANNQGAIPNLKPGMSVAGRSLQYRLGVTLGNDPTVSSSILGADFVVDTAAQSTKTDAIKTYIAAVDFNAGAYSNTTAIAGEGLTFFGATTTFDDPNDITGAGQALNSAGVTTTFGSGSPVAHIVDKQLALDCAASNEARLRLDFAGNPADFTAEVDIVLHTGIMGGLVYRTTSWVASDGSYAYAVQVDTQGINLYKGTNGGANTPTQLGTAALSLQDKSTHRLKVVALGSSHKVYLDDTLYLNVTDSTYTAPGNIGLRNRNTTASTYSLIFDNFGIATALSGTWTSNAIDISGAGTYGDSAVTWDSTKTPNGTGVTVQTSLDGGTTWAAVTNGGAIPGLAAGASLAGKTVKLLITLTANNAPVQPIIGGVSVWVLGQYASSGTRVSPALNASSVGRAGSSSVSWVASTPTGASLGVDTSTDGATWTAVSPSGAAVPGLNGQPQPTLDPFTTNTSASYSAFTFGGGTSAAWTYDTANGRIVATGGVNAGYQRNDLAAANDSAVYADMDYSDGAGLMSNAHLGTGGSTDLYYLAIGDNSALNAPGTMKLSRRVNGVLTQVGSASINFPRNTPHRFMLQEAAGIVTASMDGVQLISYNDASPVAAGKAGLFMLNGGRAQFYNLRVQVLGDLLTTYTTLYTRLRLSSTDPTASPTVQDLTLSVRGVDIMSGATIPSTAYQYQSTNAGVLDDLGGKSNYWWIIDQNKKLKFKVKPADPAPWPLATVNGDIQWSTPPKLRMTSPAYRNRQTIIGGLGPTSSVITESFIGDGVTTSWDLKYPVQSIVQVTASRRLSSNGVFGSNAIYAVPVTLGVAGVDPAGRTFYYAVGSSSIAQDSGANPLDGLTTWTIQYYGQIPVVKVSDNVTQQALLASLDGTSGIVEAVEQVDGLDGTAAQQLADARLAEYAVLNREWSFTTLRPGLAPGQSLNCFVPEYGLNNAVMLITEVKITITNAAAGAYFVYDVTTTEGPNIGTWTKFFTAQAPGS